MKFQKFFYAILRSVFRVHIVESKSNAQKESVTLIQTGISFCDEDLNGVLAFTVKRFFIYG